MDSFENWDDWAAILDQIEAAREGHKLDTLQPGLLHILRYPHNWKLRETVLECLQELRNPSEELLVEVWDIMMDSDVCYEQRILAADCLEHICAHHLKTRERVMSDMRRLMETPIPAIVHEALLRILKRLDAEPTKVFPLRPDDANDDGKRRSMGLRRRDDDADGNGDN